MTVFSHNHDFSVMEPRELADLREIFDEACRRTRTAPEAAQMLAKRLLAATRSGVKDRDKLLRLARAKAAA